MIAAVVLGLSIAGFAAIRAAQPSAAAATEQVTALRNNPSTPGEVIVESVSTGSADLAYPNGERSPVHRYSVSTQQAAKLSIGETVPSTFDAGSNGSSTNETLAAIVIGFCLIGVGMLVIGATGTSRPNAAHQ